MRHEEVIPSSSDCKTSRATAAVSNEAFLLQVPNRARAGNQFKTKEPCEDVVTTDPPGSASGDTIKAVLSREQMVQPILTKDMSTPQPRIAGVSEASPGSDHCINAANVKLWPQQEQPSQLELQPQLEQRLQHQVPLPQQQLRPQQQPQPQPQPKLPHRTGTPKSNFSSARTYQLRQTSPPRSQSVLAPISQHQSFRQVDAYSNRATVAGSTLQQQQQQQRPHRMNSLNSQIPHMRGMIPTTSQDGVLQQGDAVGTSAKALVAAGERQQQADSLGGSRRVVIGKAGFQQPVMAGKVTTASAQIALRNARTGGVASPGIRPPSTPSTRPGSLAATPSTRSLAGNSNANSLCAGGGSLRAAVAANRTNTPNVRSAVPSVHLATSTSQSAAQIGRLVTQNSWTTTPTVGLTSQQSPSASDAAQSTRP